MVLRCFMFPKENGYMKNLSSVIIFLTKNTSGYGCINLIVIMITQCLPISNHHIVYLKYIQLLCVNYNSVSLGKYR